MIDTGTILYIEQPRTGSTWSCHMFKEILGFTRDPAFSRHIAARDVDRAGRAVVGTTRPPMAWYLSAWSHLQKLQAPYLKRFGQGDEEFKPVLYGMTHPWELPHWPKERDINIVASPGDFTFWWQDVRYGLWTASIQWFYQDDEGNWIVDRLVRTDNLVADWAQVLGISPDLLTGRKPLNDSIRPDIDIDDEMVEWVQQADGDMWKALTPFLVTP